MQRFSVPAGLKACPRRISTVLRGDASKRAGFVARLVKLGLVGFSSESRAWVQPFFVSKKDGRLRIVWDCRAANMHFRSPPDVDMGGGEAFQRVDLQGHQQLSVAQVDVENCFYQCALPAWASPYFALEPVTVDDAREMGAPVDIKGNPLPASGRIFPVLVVYPMGWS